MRDRVQRSAGLVSPIPAPRLEGIPQIMQPAFELGAKLQSELICLCCHRTEAWLNFPSRMATCKTLTDVAAVQGAFLGEMQHDYAEFVDCVLRDTLIEQDEFQNGNGNKAPSQETLSRKALQKKLNAA
jgi:hypothetical protein